MSLSFNSAWDIDSIQRMSMASLLDFFNTYSFGTMAVDAQARIAWIHEKYVEFLGLESADAALSRPVEEVIPHSRMREVVTTGKPIMLDIMPIQGQSLVVVRLPLRDDAGNITGAFAFALYENIEQLKPFVSRFSELQSALENQIRLLHQARE